MKLLCAQVLKDLLGEGIDVRCNTPHIKSHCCAQLFRTITDLASPVSLQYDKVAKLTSDAKFGKFSLVLLRGRQVQLLL